MRLPQIRITLRQVLISGIVIASSLAFLSWLMVGVRRAREEVRSGRCGGNLSQLQLALLNYEQDYGCLPPPAFTDANGKPLLSWRVSVLPYFDEEGLYKQIKLDEPWDSPHNRRLHARMPSFFRCENKDGPTDQSSTRYMVVVGPRTLFPGGGQVRRLADIRDDPASTLMIVESQTSAVCWMEPRDLEWDRMSFHVDDPDKPSISSDHHHGSYPGPHVAAAGHGTTRGDNLVVASLDGSMSPAFVKALLMIDDGENAILRRGPRLPERP